MSPFLDSHITLHLSPEAPCLPDLLPSTPPSSSARGSRRSSTASLRRFVSSEPGCSSSGTIGSAGGMSAFCLAVSVLTTVCPALTQRMESLSRAARNVYLSDIACGQELISSDVAWEHARWLIPSATRSASLRCWNNRPAEVRHSANLKSTLCLTFKTSNKRLIETPCPLVAPLALHAGGLAVEGSQVDQLLAAEANGLSPISVEALHTVAIQTKRHRRHHRQNPSSLEAELHRPVR